MPAAAAFWSNVFVDGRLVFCELGCSQLQSGQTPVEDSYEVHREVIRAVLYRLSQRIPKPFLTYQTRDEINSRWVDLSSPLDAQPEPAFREGWDGMLTTGARIEGGWGGLL